jgi:hypothetical protein
MSRQSSKIVSLTALRAAADVEHEKSIMVEVPASWATNDPVATVFRHFRGSFQWCKP